MITEISSKLAAFVVALMMNAMIFAGVGYIFDIQWNSAEPPNIADSGSAVADHTG
jgi:hypothetical protein